MSFDLDAHPAGSSSTQAPLLAIDDRVEGNYRAAGTWYKGVVTGVHRPGGLTKGGAAYDVLYDDDETEMAVPAALVRAVRRQPLAARLLLSTSPEAASVPEALGEGGEDEGAERVQSPWQPGECEYDRDKEEEEEELEGSIQYSATASPVRAGAGAGAGAGALLSPANGSTGSAEPEEGEEGDSLVLSASMDR